MTKKAPFLLGLFLICMATLMLQIIQTRILSVVAMYYLAFLSISMAMLGMTAGALVVYYRLRAVTPRNVADALSVCSTLFSLVMATCFVIQLASPLAIFRVATIFVMWVKVLVLLALPFVVSGVVVSLALTRSPFAMGVTYAVDLIGAALGCLVVLLLLNSIDAPSAIFVVAALAAFAGMMLSSGRRRACRHRTCHVGGAIAAPAGTGGRHPAGVGVRQRGDAFRPATAIGEVSIASRPLRRSSSRNGIRSRGLP